MLGCESKYPICGESEDTKHEVHHHLCCAADVDIPGAKAFFESTKTSFCYRSKLEPLHEMGRMFRARVKGTSTHHFSYRNVTERHRMRSNQL